MYAGAKTPNFTYMLMEFNLDVTVQVRDVEFMVGAPWKYQLSIQQQWKKQNLC